MQKDVVLIIQHWASGYQIVTSLMLPRPLCAPMYFLLYHHNEQRYFVKFNSTIFIYYYDVNYTLVLLGITIASTWYLI